MRRIFLATTALFCTAALALILGIGTAAAETGTLALSRADLNCFRIYIKETNNNYAVVYASISTAGAIGLISMFVDYAGSVVTIETDGTSVNCGDGSFLRITGVRF